MANLATLLIGLGLDTREYDEGLDKAEAKSTSFGSKIASGLGTAVKVGLAATAGIAAAGIGAMVAGVASNAEFERYETQFGVLLGSTDAARQRLQELAQFGASTPFDLPGVVRADKILQGFGLHSDEAAKKFGYSGEQIRTIAGDVAAGTGSSFEEMSLLLGKFSAGATGEAIARMAELGIASKADLAAMGLEFSKSGELLSPLPESMNVVLQLMNDKFGGMMQAQSSTFEGMVSNLLDWKDATLRTLAAPIFEVVRDKLAALLVFLNDPATQAGLTAFANALANGVGVAMDFIANTAIPALTNAWATISPVVMPVIQLIGDNFMGVLAGVGAAVAAVVVPAMASAVAAFLAVAAPIAAAIAIGVLLYQGWNTNFLGIRTTVETVIAAVRSVIEVGLAFVRAFWEQNSVSILAATDRSFNQIKSIVATVLAIVQSVVTTVLGGIVSFWNSNHDQILAVATVVWDGIRTYIDVVLQAISGVLRAVLVAMRGDWQGAWEIIQRTAENIVNTIKTNLGEHFEALKNAVIEKATAIKDQVLAKLTELQTTISGLGPRFLTAATAIGQAVIDGIKNAISGGVGALAGAVQDAAQRALDAGKALLGIHSPSSVYEAEVGEPMIDGIVVGVTNRIPMLEDALVGGLSNLVTKAVEELPKLAREFDGTLSNLVTTTAEAGAATLTEFEQFVANLNMPVRGQLPKLVDEYSGNLSNLITTTDTVLGQTAEAVRAGFQRISEIPGPVLQGPTYSGGGPVMPNMDLGTGAPSGGLSNLPTSGGGMSNSGPTNNITVNATYAERPNMTVTDELRAAAMLLG